MLASDKLALLRQYDTPTICNVIELFAVRPRNTGYMDARIRACFDAPPAVGYASTATIRTAFPPASGSVYSSVDEQVRRFADLAGPAFVVFQDLDDPAASATFGEIMCASYQAFGAVGLITSGAARDLDQVRRLGFPVWSNGAICSHGYSHIVAVHQTVRVGGLAVHPGDLIHADANGVTNIPLEIAAEVADAAAEYAAAEACALEHCRAISGAGKQAADCGAYAEARRETMRKIEELGRRIRGRNA